MRENEELCSWLDAQHIAYDMRRDVVYIHGCGRAFIQKNYDHIFKKSADGTIKFACIENEEFLKADDIFYVVFQFGNRWYYVDIREDTESLQFHVLRYVGEHVGFETNVEYYPLGIHTGYELLNGSGLLEDWCRKATFLGYHGVGICDRNTMAATLDLQKTASSSGLKYVFGYSLTVIVDVKEVDVKVYCLNDVGLRNLLRIQKIVCVDNVEKKTISLIELLRYGGGNVLVFGKMMGNWLSENSEDLMDFESSFEALYFQVDLSEYRADRIDSALLTSQKAYFDKFYSYSGYLHNIKPILIQDMYYLDEGDWKNKIILNKVDIGASHEQSRKQYMKTIDELWDEFDALFSDKYDEQVFFDMCESTVEIAGEASASYDLSENYMPEYIMTKAEKKKYGNNHNMFLSLIEEGFKKYVPEGQEEIYRQRIEYEKRILEETDNIDYLLVQYDTVNWARKHGILVGIGRGSAGGSLALYLLGITLIDPIRYDLIFERFLIPERAGLVPEEVTVVCDDVDSRDYYEVKMENGRVYRIDKDAQMKVVRNGEEMAVYADELEENDDIVFDNRDLLFTLNEIDYND